MPIANLKKALITGASAGLGAEFARQLAAKGTALVLVARREAALEEVAKEARAFGVDVEVVVCDLENPQERGRLANSIALRGVDLLVNNAGWGKLGPFVESDVEDALSQVELNVKALVELSLAAAKEFSRRGRGGIINVASTAAFSPLPWFAVYGATKSFVRDFSHALAVELEPMGVRVTSVNPGPTRTEFFQRSGRHGLFEKQLMKASDCVREALKGFEQGQRDVTTGLSNKLLALLAGLTPRSLSLVFMKAYMSRR
jgi:short-subunit dehydrogenase